MENIQSPACLRIGDPAPDFEAMTTTGPIRFSEFNKGAWVILFSHPADFTPVCTTELLGFAREHDFFRQRNTKLIGLSIDSIHSHLAWVQNVREKLGVLLDFPIIEDISMKVASQYGMIHPGQSTTATVRTVFFIDPKGIVRLIMYYPMNVGRSMVEIQRVLVALQTVDEYQMVLPMDWKSGDKAIMPPPRTLKQLEERIADTSCEKVDFYLARRDLPTGTPRAAGGN